MGAHAGQQFLNAERLGDVVVGAGVERLDLGALVVAHGKNQDGVEEVRGWRGTPRRR